MRRSVVLVMTGLAWMESMLGVGWGISERTAKLLASCGVQAIDVAGAGGTSWSQVEMHRAKSESQARLAAAFVDWGIPTADSIRQVRRGASIWCTQTANAKIFMMAAAT